MSVYSGRRERKEERKKFVLTRPSVRLVWSSSSFVLCRAVLCCLFSRAVLPFAVNTLSLGGDRVGGGKGLV